VASEGECDRGETGRILECLEPIATTGDALGLVSACIEHDATRLLLEDRHLPPAFFDLRTGFAGEFVQKLVNYRMQLAVVFSDVAKHGSASSSSCWRRGGRGFRAFDDRERARLAGGRLTYPFGGLVRSWVVDTRRGADRMAYPNPITDSPFAVQPQVREPWRRYLDSLAPLRPSLHRYCSRLTGNVWDGEDLAQDTLVRVFSLLGKIDADLENPRGYLIRTATNLWIDRTRRRTLEREFAAGERASQRGTSARGPMSGAAAGSQHDPARATEVREAASELLSRLAPQERAAVLLKEVFDLSLEETASVLGPAWAR
jgi:RNA polymerase sigma factor (sigma-70 family)